MSATATDRPTVSILISGPSRTGKTTAAEMLAARYGIDKTKIGEEFRAQTGIDTSSWVDRDPLIDKLMDDRQSALIRSATREAPFILEGRLAAFLASRERAERPWLPIVTLLFWAPAEVRMERQLRKVRREQPESTITLEELANGEREREARDLELWRLVHPELDVQNVFDPDLTDPTGRPVYDLVVDTRLGSPLACAEFVHEWLVRIGEIERSSVYAG